MPQDFFGEVWGLVLSQFMIRVGLVRGGSVLPTAIKVENRQARVQTGGARGQRALR